MWIWFADICQAIAIHARRLAYHADFLHGECLKRVKFERLRWK